jgi:prophage regulatory protein
MKLLRLKDVLQIVPVSKATWYSILKTPNAPKTYRLARNVVAWDESDIARWATEQARTDKQI